MSRDDSFSIREWVALGGRTTIRQWEGFITNNHLEHAYCRPPDLEYLKELKEIEDKKKINNSKYGKKAWFSKNKKQRIPAYVTVVAEYKGRIKKERFTRKDILSHGKDLKSFIKYAKNILETQLLAEYVNSKEYKLKVCKEKLKL